MRGVHIRSYLIKDRVKIKSGVCLNSRLVPRIHHLVLSSLGELGSLGTISRGGSQVYVVFYVLEQKNRRAGLFWSECFGDKEGIKPRDRECFRVTQNSSLSPSSGKFGSVSGPPW